MTHQTDTATLSVDDLWLGELAEECIARLERLLAAHAAFDDYLRTRQDADDGCCADAD